MATETHFSIVGASSSFPQEVPSLADGTAEGERDEESCDPGGAGDLSLGSLRQKW